MVTTDRPELIFERLKALRNEQGLSAEQAARKADVSVRHLRRLEAGQRPNTSAVTLARVALALGTTVEYLLGLTDDARSIQQLTERSGG
jgi:transcriptional regulator with XRE-family HTH domain